MLKTIEVVAAIIAIFCISGGAAILIATYGLNRLFRDTEHHS